MRFVLIITLFLALASCKKQIGGPRKLTAVGHIEYSFSTGIITSVFYDEKNDPRVFSIRINKDYTLGGDISGTWAHSGAQLILNVNGNFGPSSPFTVDYGYYETRDFIAIEGKEVNMRNFAKKTYFIAESKGTLSGSLYYRYFVLK